LELGNTVRIPKERGIRRGFLEPPIGGLPSIFEDGSTLVEPVHAEGSAMCVAVIEL
jgi:hypothetical protein